VKGKSYKTCVHCGTPFSAIARRDSEFCCNGCEYVHRLIKREGLDHYYELRDRQIDPVPSRAFQPMDYAWLETLGAESEASAEGTAEMVLDLEGISCVGCVWMIEKLFRQHPGAVRIDINTQYGQVRLQWRPGIFRVVDFAREIQQFGYILGPPGERPQEESRRLLGRLGLCGAFAMNAMLFTLPRYLGMSPDFTLAPLFELLSLLFATLSVLAGGSYFIKRGFYGILRGILHIDFPIAIGIILAWFGSVFGWLIADVRFLYFDFVAIFIFLMLVGRWVQERALETNRNRLLSRNKAPRDVTIVEDDLQTVSHQPLERLQPGQRMRILPGEAVPVLAELESLQASLSLEWINGESSMRTLSRNQYLPSGAQNIGLEPILATARQTWRESLLSRLLGSQVEEHRNRRMEEVLRSYIIIVLLVAAAGAALWSLPLGDPLTAIQVALSVLVVSCPCAIGVAFPLAQEWAVLHLRPAGIFARSGDLFGRLGRIRQVILDKTGTLTLEAPELDNPEVLAGLAPEDEAVLREMVKTSLHPVSRALREAFLTREPDRESVAGAIRVHEEVGFGLIAEPEAGTTRWTLGRPGWHGGDAGSASGDDCEFRRDGRLVAGFRFHEALREDAVSAVQALGRRFPITILSGDRREKVRAMTASLGLAEQAGIAEQTPEEKEAFVESLGDRAALYIGDGANDALAFARAAVRGTPATPHGLLQDQADFYFTGRSLKGLLQLFHIRDLRGKAINRTFAFAVTYNIVVVAIALSGKMHPLLAAILMPLSSLTTIGLVALTYRHAARKLQA
jgi:Cu2+-exporting ATPase